MEYQRLHFNLKRDPQSKPLKFLVTCHKLWNIAQKNEKYKNEVSIKVKTHFNLSKLQAQSLEKYLTTNVMDKADFRALEKQSQLMDTDRVKSDGLGANLEN